MKILNQNIRFKVCHELQTWLDQYLEVIYEASQCYIPFLHWTDTVEIDRQATARMLLLSNAINIKDKFRIAAIKYVLVSFIS